MVRYSILGVLAVLLTAASASAQATSRVTDVNPVYDVERNGKKGMLIQVKWQIDRARDVKCNIAAFFALRDGTKLLARPGVYSTPDGQVTTQQNITPMYDQTDVKTDLFIPYEELSLNIAGRYEFRFHIDVAMWNGSSWQSLTITQPKYFTLTQN
jgi:hypothetical protein